MAWNSHIGAFGSSIGAQISCRRACSSSSKACISSSGQGLQSLESPEALSFSRGLAFSPSDATTLPHFIIMPVLMIETDVWCDDCDNDGWCIMMLKIRITHRLPDVHVKELLPLGSEEKGETKRGTLNTILIRLDQIKFNQIKKRSRETSWKKELKLIRSRGD